MNANVAVMPPHAEDCDWAISNDPCTCGLDDFVTAILDIAARRYLRFAELPAEDGAGAYMTIVHGGETDRPEDWGIAWEAARSALRPLEAP